MAALQCDICGGKLMAKSGGLFECEYCGMQYDKLRIQEMVQEIKGTVKVEGTVEVTGTVKLDGPVKVEGSITLENLLTRGKDALADCTWDRADDFFEKALDINPGNAQAYLGKMMAELQVRKQEDLKDSAEPFDSSLYYKKVMQFADAPLRNTLNDYLIAINQRKADVRIAELAQRQAEAVKHFAQFAEIDDGILKKYKGEDTDLLIPNTVTHIAEEAFSWCKSLRSVVIPDSVVSIGNYAFRACKNLISVQFPDSLLSIGDGAFWCCENLTSVQLPDSLLSVGDSAFGYCKGLTSVTIPQNVSGISDAFFECENLVRFWVSAQNTYYSSDDSGALFNKDKTCLLQVPAGLQGSYTIADGVAEINDYAFIACKKLTSVTIPDSVVTIGKGAFMNCKGLSSVTLPSSIVTIGDEAFLGCESLTTAQIPSGVSNIGINPFGGCESLSGIWVSDHNKHYANDVFGALLNKDNTILINVPGCVQSDYIIPNTVRRLEAYAFYSCSNLTSVTIPETVTSIAKGTFLWCSNLESVTIPKSVVCIDDDAFDSRERNSKLRIYTPLNSFAEQWAKQKQIPVSEDADSKRIRIEKEKNEELIARENLQRIVKERRAAGLCQHCGGELKGLFSKKCVACGKPKDY